MDPVTNSPIPIAVVGAGWVGSARHLPTLRADSRFRVVGVVDRHEGRVQAAARRFRLHRTAVASSLAGVPWLGEVAAITIATPPDSHGRLLAEARELGLHVLTEKPFALDLAEAERAAMPSQSVVAVMHNFGFGRSATRLWADIATGRLGELRGVSGIQLSNPARRLPEWYEELPLGLFFDESPHLLYLLRRIAPDLTLQALDVLQGRDGRRTPRLVTARYAAGPSGELPMTLSMNFEAAVSEWQFAVHGARGVGIVDIFRDIYIRLPNDGRHTTKTVARTSLAATRGHWAGYVTSGALHVTGRLRYGVDAVVGAFADGIAAGRDPQYCGRADALAVRKMQQEILDGANGRAR